MQHLLKCLDDNNYVSRHRVCDDNVSVRDIFWTHPSSIELFNTFPTVLMIDSTYKTNKYRLSLLEIVGVTSTDITFSVGICFMECEKEDNVTWVLRVCKTLLKDKKTCIWLSSPIEITLLLMGLPPCLRRPPLYYVGITSQKM